jgi:hypothetical protein
MQSEEQRKGSCGGGAGGGGGGRLYAEGAAPAYEARGFGGLTRKEGCIGCNGCNAARRPAPGQENRMSKRASTLNRFTPIMYIFMQEEQGREQEGEERGERREVL